MKKMENSFAVTGFVGKDAEIRQFTTASVARFSLAINRTEKNGEENSRTSAFMNIEAWRKNENTSSLMTFPGEASHTYFVRRKVSASRILQVPGSYSLNFF